MLGWYVLYHLFPSLDRVMLMMIIIIITTTTILPDPRKGCYVVGLGLLVRDGNDNNDAINGGGADINHGESVSERPLMME